MPATSPPPRSFPPAEFEGRLGRAQTAMRGAKLDAVLLTTEADIQYFTGFQTQFWESPTRPWFVVLPASGKPIAVIPEIGASGMAATWVDDVRTWSAPCPEDDGISLLADAINDLPAPHGQVGAMLGPESHLRMPANDFRVLCGRLADHTVVDAAGLVRDLRVVKSPAEIEKIRHVCAIASEAFEALPTKLATGMSEREACRVLRIDMIEGGADQVPYLIAGSGPGGYDSIIMGPTDRVIGTGDVLIMDTGARRDGYFCDFDRNFAFGTADDHVRRAYQTVYAATEAGFAAARPGATTGAIWAAMWTVLAAGGATGNEVGRLGHGLGLQLTEWPSHVEGGDVVCQPGMVLTLEPGMTFAPGRQMVHEENIVITEDGADYLSRRAPPELPIIG